MPISYYAARANVDYLRHQHPDWSHTQLAAALQCSKSWLEKWLKRLREELTAGVPLEQVLQGHSRARKTPPPPTHPLVVEQILAIRDQPPEGLRRVPGKVPIRYYLQRDPMLQLFQLPVPSCKTIYRILKAHDRIAKRGKPIHQPLERPAPLTSWQIDFKDVGSVPADPRSASGSMWSKRSTSSIREPPSSLMRMCAPISQRKQRGLALAMTLAKYGRPSHITLDRDPRLRG
jgi:hypothetical protein